MLYPYPSMFPTDAVSIVIGSIRGEAHEPPVVTHAVWEVIGYGVGQGYPDKKMESGEEVDLAKALEDLQQDNLLKSRKLASAVKTVPWGLLIPLLLAILNKFLHPSD